MDAADVIIFTFRFRPYSQTIRFATPCNIDNFDGIKNGGGWAGSSKIRYPNTVTARFSFVVLT